MSKFDRRINVAHSRTSEGVSKRLDPGSGFAGSCLETVGERARLAEKRPGLDDHER